MSAPVATFVVASYATDLSPSSRQPRAFSRSSRFFSFDAHRAPAASRRASFSVTVARPSRSSKGQPRTRSSARPARAQRRNCALSSPPQPQNPFGYPFVASKPTAS